MADATVEGKIVAVSDKNSSVELEGSGWVTLTEKAFGFLPKQAKGALVRITVGRDKVGYFVERVQAEPSGGRQESLPVGDVVVRKNGGVAVRPPVVRDALMKECLQKSFGLWAEFSKRSDVVPGTEALLDAVLRTANSLFIDATKEGRMDRMEARA